FRRGPTGWHPERRLLRRLRARRNPRPDTSALDDAIRDRARTPAFDLTPCAHRRRAHRAIAGPPRVHAHDPRDVAVARPAAERRRAIRLGLRPLRTALRIR